MAKIDKQAIRDAYEEVRNDGNDTNWAVMKYDGSNIVLNSTGCSFDDFASNFSDDDRVYGFLRVIAGDELSKRTKFALIVWLGKNVSGFKRARMGPDKSSVKEVIRDDIISTGYLDWARQDIWAGAFTEGVNPNVRPAEIRSDLAVPWDKRKSYAVELMINEKSELNEDFIRAAIIKAGGANYGTGTRD